MKAVALELDGVLGDTRAIWDGWLAEAARRFAAIAPLDPGSLSAERGRAAHELDRWAQRGIGDWRHSLERYAEEHAPLHLRPNAAVGAALRRLSGNAVALGVFTDAPEPLARVALAHLGAHRRIDALEAGENALARLLARLGSDAVVLYRREELVQLATERSR